LLETVGTILTVITFIVLGLGIILGEGKVRDKIAESGGVAIRYIVYSILDWGLMGLSILLVAVMRKQGASLGVTIGAMWIFDLVTAWALLALCLKSGQDLTLGRQYRKSYSLIANRSRVAGVISFLVLFAKSIIWDGPERLVEFWYIEFEKKMSCGYGALVALAALQAIFWSTVYWMGFDALSHVL
jgi:ABC-type transport system involved in multi-copper enzyme maturation permease subunit